MPCIGVTPVPSIAKVYGLLLLQTSFVAMLIVAVLVPKPEGAKVTVNVVVPPAATVDAGAEVTVKSDAFEPEKLMAPIFRGPVPELDMV